MSFHVESFLEKGWTIVDYGDRHEEKPGPILVDPGFFYYNYAIARQTCEDYKELTSACQVDQAPLCPKVAYTRKYRVKFSPPNCAGSSFALDREVFNTYEQASDKSIWLNRVYHRENGADAYQPEPQGGETTRQYHGNGTELQDPLTVSQETCDCEDDD